MKSLLAAAVLAVFGAARAEGTVFKFSSTQKEKPYQVFVHNTLCDNKKGVVNGYLQMDWRGGCTGSCVDYFYVFDHSGDFCLGKVNVVSQCNTQSIVISGDGMNGFTVSGDHTIYKVNWGIPPTKWQTQYECPVNSNTGAVYGISHF